MIQRLSIYDELDLDIEPFKELNIPPGSNNNTIKEAYKLLKPSSSPEKKLRIELSYKLIKNEYLRARYNLLKNRPLDSLDEIKNFGLKPKETETSRWIKLITEFN